MDNGLFGVFYFLFGVWDLIGSWIWNLGFFSLGL